MNSFTLSLLFASATAVHLKEGLGLEQWDGQEDLISNLADKIEEQVGLGAISVVDKDNIADIDDAILDFADIIPV